MNPLTYLPPREAAVVDCQRRALDRQAACNTLGRSPLEYIQGQSIAVSAGLIEIEGSARKY